VQQPIDSDVVHVTATTGYETAIFFAEHARADGRGHGRVAV